MRDVMAGYVERGEVPGIVTAVSRRGETHVEAFGTKTAGGGDGDLVRRDTIFRISSMTKPITAVATMILVEECKLRLDDPVDWLLPELAKRSVLKRLDGPLDETVPADREITVRDLLTFRLGLGVVMAPPDSTPIQRAMRLLLGQGPPSPATRTSAGRVAPTSRDAAAHASAWREVDVQHGSDVLGVLIARASGEPLETFLRERIFEPLGMKDTAFSVPTAKLDLFTNSYTVNVQTGALELYDEAKGGQWSSQPASPSAGGGLVSTVDDYLAFGQMLLHYGRHGDDPRILSRPSVEVMTTDQLTPEQKAASGLTSGYFDTHGWGFGVSVVTRRVDVAGNVGSFGWDGGMGTSFCVDPKEDMVGILMTQRSWSSPSPPGVCLDFWTSVYQSIDD